MTITYQVGDIEAQAATVQARDLASSETEYQAIIRAARAAAKVCGGTGSVGCQFTTQPVS